MIIIDVENNDIIVRGHANYAKYGNDIVCASISSIIYTTVNGIFNIDKSAIKFEDNNELLKITVLHESAVVKILIDNMLELLEELKNQYPKTILINK